MQTPAPRVAPSASKNSQLKTPGGVSTSSRAPTAVGRNGGIAGTQQSSLGPVAVSYQVLDPFADFASSLRSQDRVTPHTANLSVDGRKRVFVEQDGTPRVSVQVGQQTGPCVRHALDGQSVRRLELRVEFAADWDACQKHTAPVAASREHSQFGDCGTTVGRERVARNGTGAGRRRNNCRVAWRTDEDMLCHALDVGVFDRLVDEHCGGQNVDLSGQAGLRRGRNAAVELESVVKDRVDGLAVQGADDGSSVQIAD